MTLSHATKTIAISAIIAAAAPAFAHVVLETRAASAGGSYKAVFQVGHGCQGSATTGITVQIPAGFQGAKPYPKAGWTLATQTGKLARPYDSHGKQVTDDVTVISWTAAGKDNALQDAWFDEFMLRGQLPEAAGPLWFKVLQTCENGSADWSQVPASGTSTKGLKSPAPLLEVIAAVQVSNVPAAPATAKISALAQPVQVTGAWVRATVPGQKGSGAFMKITSRTATKLVGVSSPVAGVAEVHEMKMDGDVMRMRPLGDLDLPAGKTVELKSSGLHVMLMDLKQTLATGSSVPLTLRFKNAKGVESRMEINALVSTIAPAAPPLQSTASPAAAATGSMAMPMGNEHDMHKH